MAYLEKLPLASSNPQLPSHDKSLNSLPRGTDQLLSGVHLSNADVIAFLQQHLLHQAAMAATSAAQEPATSPATPTVTSPPVLSSPKLHSSFDRLLENTSHNSPRIADVSNSAMTWQRPAVTLAPAQHGGLSASRPRDGSGLADGPISLNSGKSAGNSAGNAGGNAAGNLGNFGNSGISPALTNGNSTAGSRLWLECVLAVANGQWNGSNSGPLIGPETPRGSSSNNCHVSNQNGPTAVSLSSLLRPSADSGVEKASMAATWRPNLSSSERMVSNASLLGRQASASGDSGIGRDHADVASCGSPRNLDLSVQQSMALLRAAAAAQLSKSSNTEILSSENNAASRRDPLQSSTVCHLPSFRDLMTRSNMANETNRTELTSTNNVVTAGMNVSQMPSSSGQLKNVTPGSIGALGNLSHSSALFAALSSLASGTPPRGNIGSVVSSGTNGKLDSSNSSLNSSFSLPFNSLNELRKRPFQPEEANNTSQFSINSLRLPAAKQRKVVVLSSNNMGFSISGPPPSPRGQDSVPEEAMDSLSNRMSTEDLNSSENSQNGSKNNPSLQNWQKLLIPQISEPSIPTLISRGPFPTSSSPSSPKNLTPSTPSTAPSHKLPPQSNLGYRSLSLPKSSSSPSLANSLSRKSSGPDSPRQPSLQIPKPSISTLSHSPQNSDSQNFLLFGQSLAAKLEAPRAQLPPPREVTVAAANLWLQIQRSSPTPKPLEVTEWQQIGTERQNGMEMKNGTEMRNGMELRNGTELRNGMDSRNGMEFRNGLELRNVAELRNGTELRNGSELANGTENQNRNSPPPSLPSSEPKSTAGDQPNLDLDLRL